MNSETENTGSELDGESSAAPDSSRGSTRATGDDDTLSYYSRAPRPFIGRSMNDFDDEEEKDEAGSRILTNKYLRELMKREPKKYYRTAYLNDKLFLHY